MTTKRLFARSAACLFAALSCVAMPYGAAAQESGVAEPTAGDTVVLTRLSDEAPEVFGAAHATGLRVTPRLQVIDGSTGNRLARFGLANTSADTVQFDLAVTGAAAGPQGAVVSDRTRQTALLPNLPVVVPSGYLASFSIELPAGDGPFVLAATSGDIVLEAVTVIGPHQQVVTQTGGDVDLSREADGLTLTSARSQIVLVRTTAVGLAGGSTVIDEQTAVLLAATPRTIDIADAPLTARALAVTVFDQTNGPLATAEFAQPGQQLALGAVFVLVVTCGGVALVVRKRRTARAEAPGGPSSD